MFGFDVVGCVILFVVCVRLTCSYYLLSLLSLCVRAWRRAGAPGRAGETPSERDFFLQEASLGRFLDGGPESNISLGRQSQREES